MTLCTVIRVQERIIQAPSKFIQADYNIQITKQTYSKGSIIVND